MVVLANPDHVDCVRIPEQVDIVDVRLLTEERYMLVPLCFKIITSNRHIE